MFERIRLGSVAALAVSLTMVGSGIYMATQDSGGDTTVDLASSAGGHTLPAASPHATADGETRAPAFAEAPASPTEDPTETPARVRPEAPIATPIVTVKTERPERPDFEGEPPTECLGFVYNASTSVIPIGAELWYEERSIPLEAGKAFSGTTQEMIGGFHIREGGLHLTIDYYEVGGEYMETHNVDVDANDRDGRYYDVNPCHEAYVTVSGVPRPDPPDPLDIAPDGQEDVGLLDIDPTSNLPPTPEPDPGTGVVQPHFPGTPQG